MKINIEKILKDTLQNKGKWSRKSLTMFASFAISVLMGFFILISDTFLNIEINRYAIDVFNSFMLLTATLSGVTVIDKKFTNKIPDDDTDVDCTDTTKIKDDSVPCN